MTEEEKKKNENDHKILMDNIRGLQYVLYGNPDLPGDIGMRRQLQEIHEVFTSTRAAGKLLKWTILTLGAIAVAILAIIKLLTHPVK